MAIDAKRLQAYREEVKKRTNDRGSFWKIPEGETKIYVHPQCYPDDDFETTKGFNFVEFGIHYGIGSKDAGYACLDPKKNPVLQHPILLELLANRKKDAFKLTTKTRCPVCEALDEGDKRLDPERAHLQLKWLFGVTPMFHRLTKADEWSKLKQFEPSILSAGQSMFKELTNQMMDFIPEDITDPNAAILMRIGRTGKGFRTRYTVDADKDSSRRPLQLDKGQRALIANAAKPGGPCDLFRVLANLIRSPEALLALMEGVELEDKETEGGEDHKTCYGVDWDPKDRECKECGESEGCALASKSEEEPESDDEIETEPEEAPEPEPRKPATKPAAPPATKQAPTRQAKKPEPEPDPEPEPEPDPEPEETKPDDGDPECFADYLEGEEVCDTCDLREECITKTAAKKAPAARKPAIKPAAPPATKPAPKPAPAEIKPIDEDDLADEDLDAIMEEAKKVEETKKNRGRR